jgi:hypothetical protein
LLVVDVTRLLNQVSNLGFHREYSFVAIELWVLSSKFLQTLESTSIGSRKEFLNFSLQLLWPLNIIKPIILLPKNLLEHFHVAEMFHYKVLKILKQKITLKQLNLKPWKIKGINTIFFNTTTSNTRLSFHAVQQSVSTSVTTEWL